MTDRKPTGDLFDFPTGAPAAEGNTPQQVLFDEPAPFDEPAEIDPTDHSPAEIEWQPESGNISAEAEDLEGPGDQVGIVDRFLGGLADLTLHAAGLGLAMLSSILLGFRLSPDLWPGFALFLASFSFLYTTLPLFFWGQTPGMAWRGLRAGDRSGLSLTFTQTALRWIGSVLTAGLLGLPLLFSFHRRSLADRLSHSETVVD